MQWRLHGYIKTKAVSNPLALTRALRARRARPPEVAEKVAEKVAEEVPENLAALQPRAQRA